VGFLGANAASDLSDGIEGFRQGLHEVGYVEKQNIQIDYRFGLRGLPGTPMGRRMISHGYVVSFRYSLKNSVGVLLDSLQGRVHFAFKLLANVLTEELRDFVSGQKQKPQLAGALKEVSDGEVALKDEVAAVLNLADGVEARKVHRLSLPLREFGSQKKTPIVEPLVDQIWAQPIRSRLQCLGVGNGKKSVVVQLRLSYDR
jgi:hypothetical protein